MAIFHDSYILAVSFADPIKERAIVSQEGCSIGVSDPGPWDGTGIEGEFRPTLTVWPYLIEPFCVFLFGVRITLRVTTKWCFGVMYELRHVAVDLRRINRIVREIPMVIQRFPVVRIKRLIR
ncbi:hypothetical protein A5676_05695 [Mycobacterium malmoense]|nr:hypothetical protein A5676_05695 [Mycobacterium malmoense]